MNNKNQCFTYENISSEECQIEDKKRYYKRLKIKKMIEEIKNLENNKKIFRDTMIMYIIGVGVLCAYVYVVYNSGSLINIEELLSKFNIELAEVYFSNIILVFHNIFILIIIQFYFFAFKNWAKNESEKVRMIADLKQTLLDYVIDNLDCLDYELESEINKVI